VMPSAYRFAIGGADAAPKPPDQTLTYSSL